MQQVEKISLTVTPHMARAIRESVEAGDYASASEAVHDAVRIWQHERQEHATRLEAIRTRLRQSIEDPRPSVSLEEAKERIAALHERTVRAHWD